MKPVICILADARSEHTIRWATSLAEVGYIIHIVSFRDAKIVGIKVHCLTSKYKLFKSDMQKISYFKKVLEVRKIIASVKPSILHAHYATSYGILGALSGFHPFVVSVWGTDILEFPRKTFFHGVMLKFVLYRADYICATSAALKNEASKYTRKIILQISFGVDCEKFNPSCSHIKGSSFLIGTVKGLMKHYGIDILINAFGLLVKRYPEKDIKLLIIGEGVERKNLEAMVEDFGLTSKVEFVGKVEHSNVPLYIKKMDVFLALSRRESFGVAVLEASACGVPVVVSNVGGLPEVVLDGYTGFIIPPDHVKAAMAIEKIMLIPDLGRKMGIMGRKFVIEKYNWNNSVAQMTHLYDKIFNMKEKVII